MCYPNLAKPEPKRIQTTETQKARSFYKFFSVFSVALWLIFLLKMQEFCC
jgi:hypothetical protein